MNTDTERALYTALLELSLGKEGECWCASWGGLGRPIGGHFWECRQAQRALALLKAKSVSDTVMVGEEESRL